MRSKILVARRSLINMYQPIANVFKVALIRLFERSRAYFVLAYFRDSINLSKMAHSKNFFSSFL